MLKVGNELLCKKSNDSRYNNKLKKNEYYTIIDIDNNLVYFSDKLLCKKIKKNYNLKNKYYTIEIVYVNDCYDWYSSNPESSWYIWDYFYKPQEMRKMKLKQLKQC